MFKRKELFFIEIMITASLLLSGSMFKSAEVELDPGKRIVYQSVTADKLIVSYNGNKKSAKEQYEDNYFAVYGKIGEIKKNNKEISLLGTDISGNSKIVCDTSKETIKSVVGSLNSGDLVKAYGQIDSTFISGQVRIEVDRIEKVNAISKSESEYGLASGLSVDKEYLMKKALNKGKIQFFIPPEWTNVETDISAAGNGYIDGYQYRLNELSKTTVPESFFVCYFDNSLLASPNDKDSTELIEKAIIANILKQDPAKLNNKFPLKKIKSYYGPEYTYYQDSYQDSNDGYRVEFVFQPVEKDGVIVYLYVYQNQEHSDNIMLTMRLLEID